MNWEDPDASMDTVCDDASVPPDAAGGVSVNGSRPGSPWYSMCAPSCSSPSNTGFIGRA